MARFRKPPPTWPPPKKMPVSYLEELCIKNNVQPVYDYLDCEGQDHDAVFKYKVCVQDIIGVGRGKNKKIAKHYAAQDFLHKVVDCGRQAEFFGQNCGYYGGDGHQFLKEILFDLDPMPGGLNEMNAAALRQRTLDVVDDPSGKTLPPSNGKNDDDTRPTVAVVDPSEKTPSSSAKNVDVGHPTAVVVVDDSTSIGNDFPSNNPINVLDELCRRRRWFEAVYCDTQERGMPHEKTFTVRLHLGKFCVEESGRSKKLAKKQAAEAMLKLLHELPLEKRDEDLIFVEDPVASEKEEQDPIDDAQKFSLKIDENQNGENINNDQKEKTADVICDTIPEEKLDENGQFSDPKSAEQEAECLSILKSTEWHTVQIPNEEHKNLMIRVSGIFGFRTSFSHLPRKPESDLRQCLLEIEDTGMTCFGYGSTEREAEFRAALNALDLYKLNFS